MAKILAFPRAWRRSVTRPQPVEPVPIPFYEMWDVVARFAAEIRASEFMAQMMQRRDAQGTQGLMGALDCATLYALTRWQRPAVIIESGGFVGLSASFILKALADEGLTGARLYSIESSKDCNHGVLIPDALRSQFVPVRAKVEDVVGSDKLPASVDMFIHDSSHRYRHMHWEFQEFWPRLRDGGLLISHDVHMNAAFPEFVVNTYAHEKKSGLLDVSRTSHYEWGRWGYIGFVIKKSEEAKQ